MHTSHRIVPKIIIVAVAAGLLALATILLTPSPAPAKPAISWMPGATTQTILAGASTTVPISFTATEHLTNVVMRVVPELAPYVEVNPASFTSISKGQVVNLTLTIAAPADALPGTFDGVIQLRSGAGAPKTFAKPLKVRVEVVWQTFSHPEGRYSLTFPPSIVAEFIDGTLVLKRNSAQANEEEPSLRFSIDSNDVGLSAHEYYDGSPGRNLIEQSEGSVSEITIGGLTAFKFVPVISFAGEVVVIIPRDDEFIRVTDDGGSFQDNELFELILGTLEL